MQTPSTLQLARQGEPQAIAALINQKLKPKGITAKVAIKERTLKILLESGVVPDQESLTAFVVKGITSLNIQALDRLQVFGKRVDQSTPAWTQVYPLKAKAPTVNSISADTAIESSALGDDSTSTPEEPVGKEVSAPSDNLETIANLLERAIADDQITIKVTQAEKLLKITLETNKFLDGQSFATRIHQELKNADLSQFEAVNIYKQKLSSSQSFQIRSFKLDQFQIEESKPEAPQELSTDSQKFSPDRRTVDRPTTPKPKIKIDRLISTIVIGGIAAFFIIQAIRRMIVVIWLSPAFGFFSVFLALLVLWRAWSVLNPLLQALLRGE